MENMRHRRPLQLSGGQQQRVAIARALVGDPAIILADEPTGALDSQTSQIIMDLFHTLHDEGRTLILITHEQQVAAQCQRQIILTDGQIILDQRS
jgi:putative ABC transport system ATP-binding protein